MAKKPKHSFIGTPIPPELHEAVKARAKEDDLTVAQVIRRLMEAYVNNEVGISSSVEMS